MNIDANNLDAAAGGALGAHFVLAIGWAEPGWNQVAVFGAVLIVRFFYRLCYTSQT